MDRDKHTTNNSLPTEVRSGTSLTVAIAAGGTGGHIYPGLAVAAAIQARRPDTRILFVGTPSGMERSLVPAEGYPLYLVDMVPAARSAGWRRYVLPVVTARAAWQSRSLLMREGVRVVVGMGGYASLAVVAGARLAGIPTIIHESNAVPGRANQLSAYLTPHIGTALSAGWRPRGRNARFVGMPLNDSLSDFDRASLRPVARARWGLDEGTLLIVVNGGSQGAARLDQAAIDLAIRWQHRDDRHLLIKASQGMSERVRRQINDAGASHVATVVPYLDRMDQVYAAADLMIGRAGAATVAELALVGVPSILVPYPYAPHDHQTHNARVLAETGAALLVSDSQASGPAWCTLVESLVDNSGRLATLARAANVGNAAPVNGAGTMAEWVLELAGEIMVRKIPTSKVVNPSTKAGASR